MFVTVRQEGRKEDMIGGLGLFSTEKRTKQNLCRNRNGEKKIVLYKEMFRINREYYRCLGTEKWLRPNFLLFLFAFVPPSSGCIRPNPYSVY